MPFSLVLQCCRQQGHAGSKNAPTKSSTIQLAALGCRRTQVDLQNGHKNSSGDEIANVNLYDVRPESYQIRWNNAK